MASAICSFLQVWWNELMLLLNVLLLCVCDVCHFHDGRAHHQFSAVGRHA